MFCVILEYNYVNTFIGYALYLAKSNAVDSHHKAAIILKIIFIIEKRSVLLNGKMVK